MCTTREWLTQDEIEIRIEQANEMIREWIAQEEQRGEPFHALRRWLATLQARIGGVRKGTFRVPVLLMQYYGLPTQYLRIAGGKATGIERGGRRSKKLGRELLTQLAL